MTQEGREDRNDERSRGRSVRATGSLLSTADCENEPKRQTRVGSMQPSQKACMAASAGQRPGIATARIWQTKPKIWMISTATLS